MGACPGRCLSACNAVRSRLLRTKPLGAMAPESDGLTEAGGLARVLTTVDLVSLGVGSCVGTGMYVVAGLVAKAVAGPAVILSFVFAAVASILSGVCYAEFAVRVPKTTGSAYTYSYVTVGEFVAFLIGWNLILEYLIGTAAGASALSSMFDSLTNHSISSYMTSHLGTLRGLGKGEDTPPDLLALFIALLVTGVIALGVKNSVRLNNVLNVVNLLVWVFIIVAGLFFISASNWSHGRFMPYGWSGVMQGAATCFYAFIGFDIIATTGEEAQSPNTSIPYAISASLLTCLTAYLSVSVVLTLMVPYQLIDGSAPLMEMFAVHGFLWGKYMVAAGSIAGLTVSLLGSLFPMPRVIYAMARDGLLFKFLCHLSAFTHTPVVACLVSGCLAGILALLVSLRDLIEMMSIGTLLAYTLVSVCVLLLRYQPPDDTLDAANAEGAPDAPDAANGYDAPDAANAEDALGDQNGEQSLKDEQVLLDDEEASSYHSGKADGYSSDFHTGHTPSRFTRYLKTQSNNFKQSLQLPDSSNKPTMETGETVTECTAYIVILSFSIWACVIFGMDSLGMVYNSLAIITLSLFLLAKQLLVIVRQPENPKKLAYMVPCVPFVPAAAILVNSYLMLKLSALTWIRFAIWCLIGLLIYGGYGVWHSALEVGDQRQRAHASSYQRYDQHLDMDDTPYQGWSAPEEGGLQQEHQSYDQSGYQYENQGSRTRGTTNYGFEDEEH